MSYSNDKGKKKKRKKKNPWKWFLPDIKIAEDYPVSQCGYSLTRPSRIIFHSVSSPGYDKGGGAHTRFPSQTVNVLWWVNVCFKNTRTDGFPISTSFLFVLQTPSFSQATHGSWFHPAQTQIPQYLQLKQTWNESGNQMKRACWVVQYVYNPGQILDYRSPVCLMNSQKLLEEAEIPFISTSSYRYFDCLIHKTVQRNHNSGLSSVSLRTTSSDSSRALRSRNNSSYLEKQKWINW